MNIDELNGCFDSITPTKEQKERILAGVMQAKNQPVRVVKFHRYATAVAAVFVIGLFAVAYPQISKKTMPVEVENPTVAVGNQMYVTDGISNSDDSNDVFDEEEVSVPSHTYRENSFKEEIRTTYPDSTGLTDSKDSTDNAPMVAMNENQPVSRALQEPIENSSEEISMGSAGGSTSAFALNNYAGLTYEQTINHSEYSKYIPVYIPEGYEFVLAEEYEDSMQMFYEKTNGDKLYVTICSEYGGTDIAETEDIKNIGYKECINVTVKCDEYYVRYNIDNTTGEDVYKMITSSAYYKE